MSDIFPKQPTASTLAQRLAETCRRFEAAWANGPTRIEDFLPEVDADERPAFLRCLVETDVLAHRRRGETPRPEDYLQRFPTLDAEWLEVVCRDCGSSVKGDNGSQATTTCDVAHLGRFQLLERVGQGTFGTVWRAHDPRHKRVVALKVPKPVWLSSSSFAERCRREAQAAAQFRHPNIVRLYEVVELEVDAHEGVPVLVSDYIDGVPLKELLTVRPLSFTETAELVAEMAEALDYVHGLGLVHRDVKPGNIMMESRPPEGRSGQLGRPVLVDFGLVLLEATDSSLTMEGQLIGTPAYMSPEQAAGHGHRVDRRSDVYSLGVVLYELLTGKTPFQGAQALVIHQILNEEPRPPRQVNKKIPHDLETICCNAMAREPECRYATAGALAHDLRRFLKGEPPRGRRTGPVERLWRWCRRNRTAASLLVAMVIALGAGTAATYWAIRANQGERDTLEQAEKRRAAILLGEKRLYSAEINQAHQAWLAGQFSLLDQLLDKQEPRPGGPDLRGFEWYWLKRLARQDLYTLPDHAGPLRGGLAFSADGRWLASASGKKVKVWEVKTRTERFTLTDHTQPIWDLAFSPDGHWLAGAGRAYDRNQFSPGEVKVWDMHTGKDEPVLKGFTTPVLALAFSPDSRFLACAGGAQDVPAVPGSGELKVLKMPAGTCLLTLPVGKSPVLDVAFSPDCRHLATAREDGWMQVWDAAVSRGPLSTVKAHDGPVTSVAYSPDGKRLASASVDATAKVWDAAKEGPLLKTLEWQHDGTVHGVSWSPDGRCLATASSDRTIRLWDPDNGAVIGSLRGHADNVYRIAFSPDGWRLASASADRTVKVWSAGSARVPFSWEGTNYAASCVAFHPGGGLVAAGGSDRTVRLWDTVLGLPVHVLRGHTGPLTGAAFSPGGQFLATASEDQTVLVWDPATGTRLQCLDRHTGPVRAVAFGPQGRLASAGEDGTIRLWGPATGQEIRHFGHGRAVHCLAFSPDGLLASAGDGGQVRLWDLDTGTERRAISGHSGLVRSLAFSPDGRHLAAGGDEQVIRLHDTETGECLLELPGRTASIQGLTWGPNSRLASAEGQVIKIWDTTIGQQLVALPGHTDSVMGVAFSPDGWQLVSCSSNQGARLWDARPITDDQAVQRQALGMLEGYSRQLLSLASLQARIRAADSVAEPVRQRALDMAEDFQRGLVRLNADSLIRALSHLPNLPAPDLLEAIAGKEGLSAAVRAEALAQARHYVEDPEKQHAASRRTLCRPGKKPAAYQLALHQAQAAFRLRPQNLEYQVTLGLAYYRMGVDDEALRHLQQVKLRFSDAATNPTPALLAFLAMTQHRLGKEKEALATFDRLGETMKQPSWAKDEEAKAFLAEAKTLLANK